MAIPRRHRAAQQLVRIGRYVEAMPFLVSLLLDFMLLRREPSSLVSEGSSSGMQRMALAMIAISAFLFLGALVVMYHP